jgi:A/G-specific adenine glycosylase
MDLGATLCTPRQPKCGLCPWAKSCQALALQLTDELPARRAKKEKPIRRATAFVLLTKQKQILLRRREAEGLLGRMMEIPSSPWKEGRALQLKEALKWAPLKGRWALLPGTVKHVFSHFTLELNVALATAPRKTLGKWVDLEALHEEALPSVMHKIIRHALKGIKT